MLGDDVTECRIVMFDPAGLGVLGEALHRHRVGGIDTGCGCLHHPELRDAEVPFVGHRLPELATGGADRGLEVGQGVAGRIVQVGMAEITQEGAQRVGSIRGVVRGDGQPLRDPGQQELPDEVDGPEPEASVDAVVPEIQRGRQDERVRGHVLLPRPSRAPADQQILPGLELVVLLRFEVHTHAQSTPFLSMSCLQG